MDSNMPDGRIWCFTLLFLSYIICTTSIVTQDPVLACVEETITISCDLTVPNPGDNFISSRTDFIVGSSVALSDTVVNGNGMQGGVDLSRFTADSPIGSTENVLGTLTLLSYTLADNGLTLGCTNEYIVDGNSSNTDFLTETINIQQASPPSPPVSLSTDFDSTTCSGSVELAWTAGASDRPIETYFLFLNGVDIAGISSPMNSYSHTITLQIDTDYVYSVLAMSCAGNSTLATADTITIGVPSSPVVTLSLPDTNCTNILISWTTPNSDRDITEYSVYRDNTLLTTTTDNQYTDTDQLTINTVYEYSVTAISCAGSSTPRVRTISIAGYSLATNPDLSVSYNSTSNVLYINWFLNPNPQSTPLFLSYSLILIPRHPVSPATTITFSQLSTDTNHTLSLPDELTSNGDITDITALLSISEQCGNLFSGINLISVGSPVADSSTQEYPLYVIIILVVFLFLAIITIVIMVSVIIYMYWIIRSPSAKSMVPEHKYEDINILPITKPASAKTVDPYYTPMDPVGTHSSTQESVDNTPQYFNLK